MRRGLIIEPTLPLKAGQEVNSCPRSQYARGKGSGNIVHNGLSQAQECGASNQIAGTLRHVLFACGFVFVFTVKVEWMPSLTDLVRPLGSSERL